MREEAFDEAISLYGRWFPDSDPPLHEQVVVAHLTRDSLLLRQLIAQAPAAPGRRPALAALAVARYFREMDTAERLARAGLTSSRTPELLAFHHRTLAELALARGRRAAAQQRMADAERHNEAFRYQRVLCAVVPFLPPPRNLAELIDAVAGAPPKPGGTELERALAPHVQLYVLGLLQSAKGDHAAAAQTAERLASLPAPTATASVARAFVHTILGDIAWRRGRFAEAISALEPVNGEIPSDLLMSAPFAQEHARYLRADAHFRLGNYQEALRWFAHGFVGTPTEVAYMAPVQLRLGEIHDALGDRARALHHYGLALSLWNGADADVAQLLQHARQRHAQLSGPGAEP